MTSGSRQFCPVEPFGASLLCPLHHPGAYNASCSRTATIRPTEVANLTHMIPSPSSVLCHQSSINSNLDRFIRHFTRVLVKLTGACIELVNSRTSGRVDRSRTVFSRNMVLFWVVSIFCVAACSCALVTVTFV